jgi:hypothetical protein
MLANMQPPEILASEMPNTLMMPLTIPEKTDSMAISIHFILARELVLLSVLKPLSAPIASTRYFDWNGEPCRVHRHENCHLSADIIRGPEGIKEIETIDVLSYGREISEAGYNKLVKRIATMTEFASCEPDQNCNIPLRSRD